MGPGFPLDGFAAGSEEAALAADQRVEGCRVEVKDHHEALNNHPSGPL
jgi:hypothetical protein